MLTRGQLFGTIHRTVQAGEVTLTESQYAPHTHTPAHAHELPMFVLVVDGDFDERFEHHARTCGPRRLVYRPPGERHSQRFRRRSTCLTIELPAAAAESLRRADPRTDLAGIAALVAWPMYDEFRRPTTDTPLALEELTFDLVTRAGRMAMVQERRAPPWLGRARALIDATFTRSVRLSEVAREAGVHRVHLSRTFRRFLGCNVAEYVRRLRVHAACAQIRRGGDTLSVIAAATGFSDQSHMGRAFREVLGYPPQRYWTAMDPPSAPSAWSSARRT